VASAIEGALTKPEVSTSPRTPPAGIATIYLIASDRRAVLRHVGRPVGRRKLFMITLGVYLVGSGLTAATAGAGTGWVVFLYATRIIAGMASAVSTRRSTPRSTS